MKKVFSNTIVLSLTKNTTVTQAAKYFIVGGICTFLDFLILYTLTNHFNIHYVLSSVISFMSGTILNYYLCTFWIFKIRVVENRNLEMLFYILITGVGLGINTLFIYALTEYFGLYFMVSKALAIFVTYWWNFWARKYFLHTIK